MAVESFPFLRVARLLSERTSFQLPSWLKPAVFPNRHGKSFLTGVQEMRPDSRLPSIAFLN